MATKIKLKTGEIRSVTCLRMGINGEGIATLERQIVFIPGLLVGETAQIEITEIHANYANAKILKRDDRSPDRVTPLCPVYSVCGGCQLQHMSYDGQLRYKEEMLRNAFLKSTKLNIEKADIRPTIGSKEWEYRNKSQFVVGKQGNEIVSGLYSANSNRLVAIDDCVVQNKDTLRVNQAVTKLLNDYKVPVYHAAKQDGVMRHIVVRTGIKTGEIQVVLVAFKDGFRDLEGLSRDIMDIPGVVSVVLNINDKLTSRVFGEETEVLRGVERIEEEMGEFTYQLSPRAFFQLNPEQAERMYEEIARAAALTGEERVVDAYAGVGSIGLWIAKGAKEVRGMEIIEEAVEDANAHMKQYGFDHAHYVVGKAEAWIPRWVKEGWIPDVFIVDPPRSGCDTQLLNAMISSKAKKIIYVSCNPQTLARDCDHLMKAGYKVSYIQPYDMFPQTAHVEAIVVLEKKKKKKF
ncbi:MULTISPECIES: 23S rRNA (uracil(1939)-C(5))-methyltransferase RlmD [Exiguobacterium]|uniref:23S rRNA (uracil(1939)-C(5))-methyltransferase RlmD n=1 Tax=Exiguobacterium TaxID=33986 RepID=UPI001BEBE3DA|nr:23S rRNA (uracil(1939)-C(5))-methyltransferase RlmD [Exiguobacterium sp. s144]